MNFNYKKLFLLLLLAIIVSFGITGIFWIAEKNNPTDTTAIPQQTSENITLHISEDSLC